MIANKNNKQRDSVCKDRKQVRILSSRPCACIIAHLRIYTAHFFFAPHFIQSFCFQSGMGVAEEFVALETDWPRLSTCC